MAPKAVPLEQRFWPKVQKSDGCWLWTASRLPSGYGQTSTWDGKRQRFVYAHRVSWELHFGPIPPGMHVCHHCDNPPCVRPDHLFLGTHLDNMRDARRKGRFPKAAPRVKLGVPRGERHFNAKLTDADVREIRRGYAAKEFSLTGIVKRWHIDIANASRIVNRKIWKHVTDDVPAAA